ncbi:three-Cys-motif partner protein TcmP [Thiolapillus sp.]
MEIDKSYDGREHSLIKHELLGSYLEKLLYIVGGSGEKEITYVDCFSGPWADDSDDLHGTSIAISLDIIKRVREGLAAKNNNIYDIKFRAVYVEENKSRFRKLKGYLEGNCPSFIEHHELSGDYSDLQDDILNVCGKGFAFFFVDPKGWKDVGVPRLSKLLRRSRSEFLITFMYDFMNRFLKLEDLRDPVQSMLGKVDQEFLSELQNKTPKEREDAVVRRYREHLKSVFGGEANKKSWTYHATVLNKDKNRTVYHMVYLTRHPKGIVVFSRESHQVAIFQHRVRYEKQNRITGQMPLFVPEDDDFQGEVAANIEDVKTYWLDHLSSAPAAYGQAELADWLEETGWLEYDFQRAFNELRKEGQVENLDDKSNQRTKRFVHFDKNERLRKLA